MTRPIPHDREGYAVEVDTGRVHTRYARHVQGASRTRVIRGVYALLDGREPVPCDECYPAPVKPSKTTRPATAGRIEPAREYLVGERGREVFVARSSEDDTEA